MNATGTGPAAEGMAASVRARRPSTGLRIVDAHAHMGPWSEFFVPDADADSMIRVMDRCGVAMAVVSSCLALQGDTAHGNRLTAAAVDAHPGRIAGYIAINPWQDAERELAKWADDPRFVGIKIHPDGHEYSMAAGRYRPVWDFAQERGCPVLVHTWVNSPYNSEDQIEAVAVRYPAAPILAGHALGRAWGFDSAIEIALRNPTVVLEICGSYNHRVYLERMVAAVGADRVAFGSDFPFMDIRPSLGRLAFAALSDQERALVAGGTIDRLLSWRTPVDAR